MQPHTCSLPPATLGHRGTRSCGWPTGGAPSRALQGPLVGDHCGPLSSSAQLPTTAHVAHCRPVHCIYVRHEPCVAFHRRLPLPSWVPFGRAHCCSGPCTITRCLSGFLEVEGEWTAKAVLSCTAPKLFQRNECHASSALIVPKTGPRDSGIPPPPLVTPCCWHQLWSKDFLHLQVSCHIGTLTRKSRSCTGPLSNAALYSERPLGLHTFPPWVDGAQPSWPPLQWGVPWLRAIVSEHASVRPAGPAPQG